MKKAMTLGLAALLAGAGAAMADQPKVLTGAELDRVTAAALLLPAVQAVRQAADRSPIRDGTSNTVLFGETSIPPSPAPLRPAEFIVIKIGQKTLPAVQR